MAKQETEQVLISKDMKIGDIVKKHPQVANVFLKYGLHCVGCHVAYWETLEQGAQGHGMPDDAIDKMVEEANEVAKSAKEDLNDGNEIHIMKSAIEKVKDLIKKEGKEGQCLRIGITDGGCAGMSYTFDVDDKPKKDDKVIEKDGLKVLFDKKAYDYLKGATVDFIDTLHGSGFKINNPNASHTCGCGNSFS